MRPVFAGLLLLATLFPAQAKQTFTGVFVVVRSPQAELGWLAQAGAAIVGALGVGSLIDAAIAGRGK